MEETKIEDFKESGRDEKFQQIVRRWKASKRVESWLRNALLVAVSLGLIILLDRATSVGVYLGTKMFPAASSPRVK